MIEPQKIGQGTHGTITVDSADSNIVVKSFSTSTFCKELQNEYEIQKDLESLSTEVDIMVPRACCYSNSEKNRTCEYKMDRIFSFPGYNYYLIPNLSETHMDQRFSHSTSGREVGIEPLAETYGINVRDCAFQIGKMFSYLHFIKHMDGYDCELLIGKRTQKGKAHQMFLIDFDKVQRFRFELGITVYRKISEEMVDEKKLSTAAKFSNFLFGSFISMSLLPVDKELKQLFVRGYRTYLNESDALQYEIFQRLAHEIKYYRNEDDEYEPYK